MGQAEYLLEQKDFLSNYVGSFQQLKEDKELLDVTLACEDETVEAHKVVLSACSPFFRNVFKKATHVNPFIYLKGVSHKDLVALLDYIYTGQTKVLAEDVDRFIQVGKDLQVKGLADEEDEVIENTKDKKARKTKKKRKTEELTNTSHDATNENDTSPPDEFSLVDTPKTSLDIKKEKVDVDNKKPVKLLSELSKKIEKIKDEEGISMWKCKDCGKILKSKGKLQMHVEIHLEGFSHICSHCGKSHKTRNAMQAHKSIVHRGNK